MSPSGNAPPHGCNSAFTSDKRCDNEVCSTASACSTYEWREMSTTYYEGNISSPLLRCTFPLACQAVLAQVHSVEWMRKSELERKGIA